jgi:hypothetical protein
MPGLTNTLTTNGNHAYIKMTCIEYYDYPPPALYRVHNP